MANTNKAKDTGSDVKADVAKETEKEWGWNDTFLPAEMNFGKVQPGKDVVLTVDAEFKAIIPPVNPIDKDELRKSIIREGCREPIIAWKDGDKNVILDGHNRKEICDTASIPYSIRFADCPSRGLAKEWVIRNQFARRNLCDAARVSLALRLESTIKAMAKMNQVKGGQGYKADNAMHTREVIAKIAGVSGGTVDAVRKVLSSKREGLKREMLAGKVAPSAARKELAPEIKRKAIDGEVKDGDAAPDAAPPKGGKDDSPTIPPVPDDDAPSKIFEITEFGDTSLVMESLTFGDHYYKLRFYVGGKYVCSITFPQHYSSFGWNADLTIKHPKIPAKDKAKGKDGRVFVPMVPTKDKEPVAPSKESRKAKGKGKVAAPKVPVAVGADAKLPF